MRPSWVKSLQYYSNKPEQKIPAIFARAYWLMDLWILRGKQVKVCQCKKSRSSFVYSRQQKIKNFSYKDDNGKLWVEVIIVTSLDSDDTVDVLTANDNDVNILYGIWVFHILLLLMVKKGIHYMQL